MSFAESIGQDKQDFKYNGKELDRMHDLNLYDYEARYLDNAYGRFTSVDPMAEKKPWLTPYHYCSNNPINRIDPDGRDDYFNSNGQFQKMTSSGSNIYVNIGGQNVLLSKINMSSNENRQAIANVIGYYAASSEVGISFYAKGMKPIGNNPTGTVGLKSTDMEDAAAFTNGADIYINKDGNKIDETYDDRYNLINILIHENQHKNQNAEGFEQNTPDREIDAIKTQTKHSSYSKTTTKHQLNALNYLISNIIKANMVNDDKIKNLLNDINAQNLNYQIIFERYGGGADSYRLDVIKK